jgi:hypothetical protein
VALLSQRAEIQYDPEQLLPLKIASFINDLGFSATVIETTTRGTEVIDLSVCIEMALIK